MSLNLLLSRFLGKACRAALAAGLAVPVVITGCSAETDEETEASEGALSGRVFQEGATLKVTANRLNVRSQASRSSRIVATLNRDDQVTVTKTSGSNGWVKIETEEGDEGWAAGNYLTQVSAAQSTQDDDDERETTADGATCAPGRAEGVVNRYEKALHDTIAYAEGTYNQSKSGYDILFSSSLSNLKTFSSCAHHPKKCMAFGSTCSTAAGRYQFLSGTWTSIANARGYATFEPENQERGAAYLIGSVRRATIPTDRALSAADFSNVITKLSYEWASLPPGQYGQPQKSMNELRGVYCNLVECE